MDIDLIFCKTSFVIMLFFDCICLDAAVDTLGNILDIMIMFLLHSVNFYPSTSYMKPLPCVICVSFVLAADKVWKRKDLIVNK